MAGSSASQSTGHSESYSDTYIPEYSESPFLRAVAEQARAMSDQVYQWGMDQFNKGAKDIDGLMRDALSYASPQRIAVDMGMAEAGVQQAGERGRQSAIRDLESYGIDPSSGRYAALDSANRVMTAAAAAGAGNQQRMADQAAGNAMRNQAIAAGLQNRQFGLGVGDSANRFLATASSLKYPPLGRYSTSVSDQQSTSASQQTDPASSGGGGSKGGGGSQPKQGGAAAKPSGGKQGGGDKQGKPQKPPPGKREPPKKPGEEEKPKEELKEPVDPRLQEGPTPESAITGLAEPNEVWTGDPIASGAEPGEVWTGDPIASGAEPSEVWTGDPTASGAEPNEAWTGPEPFEAGYPPPEGLDEGATPEAAITPDYSQEPPLEAGYPEYDPYAGQTLAGDPFGANYDPTAGIPQEGEDLVAQADPAGALYGVDPSGGWTGEDYFQQAGYEGPTFGGAGEWSDIGQGTMDTGAFDSTYDDFTDYGDQGYGDFGADFGDYGDTGYGDYGDYYPEGGDYGADFGDYGDTGYGDYGDYYPDDGADYGYESDYYGDESGYDFGDAGDYYDDFTDYGGEGDYGEGADDYYGDESGYDYGGEGDYGEGADDYYGDESGYDYGGDADYGYDADYYGDESGYDYGDDSGYYEGYDDSGYYDSGYDDSGGYDSGYDDSGGYDSGYDDSGGGYEGEYARGGVVRRRGKMARGPAGRPPPMRTGFRRGGMMPGRGPRRPPPGAKLAPPPVPPPEARQGGRMPGNFISANGMQPPATGGMPAPGPQARMPRAAPKIRPARPRPQHFAGGGQAGQPEPTQGGFVSRELSPSAGSKVDDVNARLNAGEFVIPKDVAQWKGKEFFYKMIAQARKLRAGGDEKPKVGYQTGGTFNPMQGAQPIMNYQTPAQIPQMPQRPMAPRGMRR